MWELNHKEAWASKNWCFWTVMLEKTLESPLSAEIKPVNLKGNQSWIFIGRADVEAEAPIFWSPDDSLAKTLMLGKSQEEKGMTEDVNDKTVKPGVLQYMGSQSRTQLSNWAERNNFSIISAAFSQETLLKVMWQTRGEGSLGENGFMYRYGWVLCCPSENITALLAGYTPIQN